MTEDHAMHGAPDRVRMTYEDLLVLPDDGMRHELVDGVHYVSPAPGSVHQLIVGNVYAALRSWLRDHPQGVVMLAPFDVVFSRHDVVEPDLMYFTSARFRKIVGETSAQGPPDLAIEILSPATRRRDVIIKRRLYERCGVSEYWIVDPRRQTVKVLCLRDGKYQCTELVLEDGALLTTRLFPELVLPLKAVFEMPQA